MSNNKILADDCAVKFAKFLKANYETELIGGNVKEICKEFFYKELSFGSYLLKELCNIFSPSNQSPLIEMDLAIFIQYFFQKCNFNVKWSWMVDNKELLFLAQYIVDYSEDLNLDNNIDSIPDAQVVLQDIDNLKQINFPSDFKCYLLRIGNCSNLTTISLPGSNRLNISYCMGLKEIRFINGILDEEYPHLVIQGCPSLNKLTLTRDTEVIPRGFIYRCYKLKEIIYEGTKEEWNKIKLEDKWCDRPLKIICSDGEIEINS